MDKFCSASIPQEELKFQLQKFIKESNAIIESLLEVEEHASKEHVDTAEAHCFYGFANRVWKFINHPILPATLVIYNC
ncbi:MAG: hypothetical protein HY779_02065 [Rubrobacteridae bacterium]|nr:hypothetical protein [Rubrobacteridae bacterium]